MLFRIRVFIDHEPVTLWSWARVRHALNWYSEDAYRDVLSGERVVCDTAGHPVDLDGALEDGARLHLEARPRPRSGRARHDPSGVARADREGARAGVRAVREGGPAEIRPSDEQDPR